MSATQSRRRSRKARRHEGHAHPGQAQRPAVQRSASPVLPPPGPAAARPRGVFGGLPVSELVILVGIIALVVGWLSHDTDAVYAGAAACGLGVLEVTAREHFAGFRSHTTLLAAVPALVAVTLVAVLIGVPAERVLVLLPGVPVFLVTASVLRRSFEVARHQRRIDVAGA